MSFPEFAEITEILFYLGKIQLYLSGVIVDENNDTTCKDVELNSSLGFTTLKDCKNGCANSRTCVAVVWSGNSCWFEDMACEIKNKVGAKAFLKRKAE